MSAPDLTTVHDVTILDEHFRVLTSWRNVTQLDVQADARAVGFITDDGRPQLVLLSTLNNLTVLDVTGAPSLVATGVTPSNLRRAAAARG